MSLDRIFKRWDARYGIPRPTNALYLDYYHAGLRLMGDVCKGFAMVAAGCVASFIWWQIGNLFQQVGIEIHIYLLFVMILCVGISFLEAGSVIFPYYRITQRVTYGSARWAEASDLRESGLALQRGSKLPQGALRIGRLGRKYDLVLPFKHVLRHMAIFGPPGSGKSSTFFMAMARDWARGGSAIFLDPKGELYEYTARHFERVYRLDLSNPEFSDRWNFVPSCRGDAELAHEIASIVVGYDPNKNVNYDPFWPQAETALLTSLLLHLPQVALNPSPAHLAEFIALHKFDQIDHIMSTSPDPEARIKWGIFKKADREKTQGGVYVGLGTKLDPLRTPHAMAIMQSLSNEERARGVREIDLYDLRKPSTGIYVIVPEGDANRYKIILSILFGLAASVARKTSADENGAPMLLVLDEAGNIPIHNLSEALGVGRGRRCGIVLGYQNIGQLYKQYGRDGAQSILGSIGGMIFLPGLDVETSQYASKKTGRTTALQHRSVDATGSTYDHEGLTETGRELIDATELRQLPEYTQAVAIFSSIPPIRFGFPQFAKVGPKCRALPRDHAAPVTLAELEVALAVRGAEEAGRLRSSVASDNLGAVGGITSGGIEFDADEGFSPRPGSSESLSRTVDEYILEDIDKLIQRTLNGETEDNGVLNTPPDHSQTNASPASLEPGLAAPRVEDRDSGLPEVKLADVRIDTAAVLQMADLEMLNGQTGARKPEVRRSAQLSFQWGPDGAAAETADTRSGAGEGGRR